MMFSISIFDYFVLTELIAGSCDSDVAQLTNLFEVDDILILYFGNFDKFKLI